MPAVTSATFTFQDACEILTPPAPMFSDAPMGRVVSHEDPAGFECGYRLTRDLQPHPDYGCVFWTDVSDYLGPKHRYDFSRDGWRFCLCGPGPVVREGWVNVQGRSFRIAGPSNAQAARDARKVAA